MAKITSLAVAILLSLSAATASATAVCTPREAAMGQLGDRFGESVSARGIGADGTVMFELLVSEQGTWTVLASDVHGKSCVIAVGEAWHEIVPVVGDPA